jgi:RNA polymerase sigma-70 factor, ECF subfamily
MQPALARDPQSFRALMRTHNQALFRTARAILRNDEEAEEAVQEAWLQAYRNMDTFRGEAKISTWLIRIAANEALMRLRRKRRTAEVIPMSVDDTPEDSMHDTTADDNPMSAPDVQALRGEVRKLIEARIDALPDAFRAVFMLRAVEELSVEETAAALEIPEATVRTRFFRARGLLREALSREMDMAVDTAFQFLGARCDRITEAVMAKLGA